MLECDAFARDRIPGGLLLHQHLALVRHAALLEGVARGIGREQGDGRHQNVDFAVLDPLRVCGIGEERRDHGLLRAIDVRRGALLRVGDLPRGVDGVTDASERGFGGAVERERREYRLQYLTDAALPELHLDELEDGTERVVRLRRDVVYAGGDELLLLVVQVL